MQPISPSSQAAAAGRPVRRTATPKNTSTCSKIGCTRTTAATVAIGSASALTYMAGRALFGLIAGPSEASSTTDKSLVPTETKTSTTLTATTAIRGGVLSAPTVEQLLIRQLELEPTRLLTASSTAQKYGTNLVQDWSADDTPFTVYGWQLTSGSWTREAIDSGGDNGLWSFYTRSGNAELSQEIPLTDYAADIASGQGRYMMEGLIVSSNLDAKIKIEFISSNQIVLGSTTKSGNQKFELLGNVPFGTTIVKIRLQTSKAGYGPWARFDAVRFVMKESVPSASIRAGELLDVVVPESAMGGHSDIEMVMTAASGSSIPSGLRFVDGRRLQWRTTSADAGTYRVKLSEADKRSGTQILSQDMQITILPADSTVCAVDDAPSGLSFGGNLIQNPSAELTPITLVGWEITSGSWERSTTGAASGMGFYTKSDFSEMTQDVDVCSHADFIKTGKQYALLGGYLKKQYSEPMLQWDCYDSAGNHIRTYKTGTTSGSIRQLVALPTGTATVKTRVQTKDIDYSYWAAFDDIHVKLLAPMPTLKLEAGNAFTYTIPGEVYGFDTSLSSVLSMADGSSLPDGLTYNPLLRQITWTPTASQIKSYDFKLRITTGSTDYPAYFSANVYSTLPSGICDIQLSFNQVPENVASGTVVGSFSAKGDVDGKTLTYALASGLGDTDNAKFQIEGSTLKAIGALDYETTPTASIRVKVSSNTDAYEKIMPISLLNANEPPSAVFLSGVTGVPESLQVGNIVGTLSSTDPDAGDQHTYTLLPSLDSEFFTIDGTSLKLAKPLDFETKSEYGILVTATDLGGFGKTVSFTITVVDVNEAPTVVRLINPSSVEEGVTDARVGELEAVDPDADDHVTFSIVPGFDGASFRITNGNVLRTTMAFDADTKPTAKLTIRATDSSGLFKDETLTISITNINEAPFDIALDSYTVEEERPIGTLVGILSSSDEDKDDRHTYTIVPGSNPADAAAFMISGNRLLTNKVLDAETKLHYSFRIRTLDLGGLAYEKPVTIDILGISDEPPTAIQLDRLVVAEAMPAGTLVGRFSTTDGDVPPDEFAYTLVSGAGDTHNTQFRIVGNQLQTAQVLDVDLEPATRSIRVRTTDLGGFSYEEAFQISVTPVNEAPVGLALTTSGISEHAEAGTLVGRFVVDDPETENTHTFELISGAGSQGNRHFAISENSLVTSSSFSLNKEVTPSTSIRIRVQDNEGASSEMIIPITVLDAPDAPTGFELSETRLARNAAPGKVVGLLSGVDEDVDEEFTFSLVETGKYPDNKFFTISKDPLSKASELILHESIPSNFGNTLSIRIKVVDKDGLSFEGVQFIQLVDELNLWEVVGGAAGGAVAVLGLATAYYRRTRARRHDNTNNANPGNAGGQCSGFFARRTVKRLNIRHGSLEFHEESYDTEAGPIARPRAGEADSKPEVPHSNPERHLSTPAASTGAAAINRGTKNAKSMPYATPRPSAPPANEESSMASISATKERNRLDAMRRAHEGRELETAINKSEFEEMKRRLAEAARKLKGLAGFEEEFICPYTLEIMEDPIQLKGGISVDRKGLLERFRGLRAIGSATQKIKHPFLKIFYTEKEIIEMDPNISLKNTIERWKRLQGTKHPILEKAPSEW